MEPPVCRRVQIFATETFGCEGRSQYYETAGTVCGIQNHVMQVFALVAIGSVSWTREIRREKTKVLAATRLGDIILGQYEGYKSEEGVDPRVTLLPSLLYFIL